MSKMLISKKGRTSMPLLIAGLLFLVVAVGWLASGEGGHKFGNSEMDDFLLNLPPFLMMIGGLLAIMGAACSAKTCIRVYDDHIEGVGIGKGAMKPHNFYFTKDMRYTVQQSGTTVKVTCGGETYSVSLSAADAQEVYRCVHSGEASSASSYNPSSSTMLKSNPSPKPAPQAAAKPNPAPRPAPQAAAKPNPAPQAAAKPNPAPQAAPKPNPAPRPAPQTAQQPKPADVKIDTCPRCRAKIRVPAGKGWIRVTCPQCGASFQMES